MVWRGEVSNCMVWWCDCEGSLCFIGVVHEGTYNDLSFVKVCAKFHDDIYPPMRLLYYIACHRLCGLINQSHCMFGWIDVIHGFIPTPSYLHGELLIAHII